ncbi:MAG: hypothetical protein HKN13_07050, partial [Rhodothermales bacterium]|nr:hypothetical protein [Rhodothermales bacterium]
MVQYSAIVAACMAVSLAIGKPDFVQPIVSAVSHLDQQVPDVAIGNLANTPPGEIVSVNGVLMKVNREADDAVLLTVSDSSGSVVVPYLDTDDRAREFDV